MASPPVLCVFCLCRDEWTEAIQMVADKLQRQEDERIQCSPTSNIHNLAEEEMDITTTHHKRKVTTLCGFKHVQSRGVARI